MSHEPDRSAVLDELRAAFGADEVLAGDASPRHLKDWSTASGGTPLAILRPRSTAELARMLASCNAHGLADLVEKALATDDERLRAAASRETIEARLATLTQREREVMEQILEGKYNKVIADELSISMLTVEAHRSRIFEKMEVRSAVELAQLLTTLRN